MVRPKINKLLKTWTKQKHNQPKNVIVAIAEWDMDWQFAQQTDIQFKFI